MRYRVLTGVLLALWAFAGCRSFSLQNDPGAPESPIEGSYRLVPFQGTVSGLNLQYYMTGVMEIKKEESGQYTLEITTMTNARVFDEYFQSRYHYSGGTVQTSRDEIAVSNTLQEAAARSYRGPPAPVHQLDPRHFEKEWKPVQDGMPHRDIYFQKISATRFSYRVSRLFTPGEVMVFERIPNEDGEGDKDSAASTNRRRKRGGIARLRGSVFLILPGQKIVTVVGTRVNKKIKPGSRIIVVRNRSVVARGRAEAVFDTHARVKILQGMEQIRPRDVTYGY